MRGGIAKEAVYFRMGPLTTYADPAELEHKFREADAGGRIVYAIGPALSPDAPVPAMVRRWQQQGLCHLARRRSGDGKGWEYFIEKRPGAATAANVVSLGKSIVGRPEEQLLAVLTGLAGRPMLSLDLLAERAGLPHRQAADYRLRLLVEGGFIRITRRGVHRFAEILQPGDVL